MNDQTNTNPAPTNVVSFLDKAKVKYYSSEYRELSIKNQVHLRAIVEYNNEYQRIQSEFDKDVV